MIEYKQCFANKKITKQGFGILGRGLGVVKFLLKNGAKVLVTDNKDVSFFREQIKELDSWIKENKISKENLKYVLGEHRIEDFTNCDYVVSASGVPKDNIYLKAARDNNIPVYQESCLFLKIIQDFNNNLPKENKIKIITITGTRGKTTTTQLIYKILKDYYKDRNIYLGGNIQGISTIELLEKIKEKDIVVMETDSWLAQGFKNIQFAPNIAVFINLMRDHMNYYHDNMNDYFTDKAQTFLYQKEDDILIAEERLKDYLNKYLDQEYLNFYNFSKSKKTFINGQNIQDDKQRYPSSLKGEHNRLNISLAIRAAEELGIDVNSIRQSIISFLGVTGRLEFVKEINRVKYYNDTTATTPDATIAALNAFRDDNSPIILITGGRDKELHIQDYTQKLITLKSSNKIKRIIFLKDGTTTGTDKVLQEMNKKNFHNYILTNDLSEAVNFAKQYSIPNDIILFSPGFASFGMFVNEYDRGKMFLKAI